MYTMITTYSAPGASTGPSGMTFTRGSVTKRLPGSVQKFVRHEGNILRVQHWGCSLLWWECQSMIKTRNLCQKHNQCWDNVIFKV